MQAMRVRVPCGRRMSVDQILREAKQVLTQGGHTTQRLAVNHRGDFVRPLDLKAVAWTSTGAVGKVAPSLSRTHASIHFDLTTEGQEAIDLLNEAAHLQGYRGDPDYPLAEVDKDGLAAALRCFAKAMQLAPSERPRRKPAAGTGSAPRGTEAA
jgi:hypothetical protein